MLVLTHRHRVGGAARLGSKVKIIMYAVKYLVDILSGQITSIHDPRRGLNGLTRPMGMPIEYSTRPVGMPIEYSTRPVGMLIRV